MYNAIDAVKEKCIEKEIAAELQNDIKDLATRADEDRNISSLTLSNQKLKDKMIAVKS